MTDTPPLRFYDGPGFACGGCGRFDQEPWNLVSLSSSDELPIIADHPCECGEKCWLPVTLAGPPGKGRYVMPFHTSWYEQTPDGGAA